MAQFFLLCCHFWRMTDKFSDFLQPQIRILFKENKLNRYYFPNKTKLSKKYFKFLRIQKIFLTQKKECFLLNQEKLVCMKSFVKLRKVFVFFLFSCTIWYRSKLIFYYNEENTVCIKITKLQLKNVYFDYKAVII